MEIIQYIIETITSLRDDPQSLLIIFLLFWNIHQEFKLRAVNRYVIELHDSRLNEAIKLAEVVTDNTNALQKMHDLLQVMMNRGRSRATD